MIIRLDASVKSTVAKAALLASCSAIVVLVAACRPQPRPPAPLQPDPEIAQRLERQKEAAAREGRARNLTAAEVAALEASLERSAEDLGTLRMLRSFYRASGAEVFGWNEMVTRRRPHIVWLIETYPEREEALWFISAQADPVGYAEAKSRWLAQAGKADASDAVLSNAAAFLSTYDPEVAERLLLRARSQAPPDRAARLSEQLGRLYADIVRGRSTPGVGGWLPVSASDSYAANVRERLLRIEDPRVLTAAGQMLSMTFPDETLRQLGLTLLERAVALDPSLAEIRRRLLAFREHDRMQAMRARPVSELPLNDRLVALSRGANGNFDVAEDMASYAPAKVQGRLEESKKAAQDALALSAQLRNHSDYGYIVYMANLALAKHAFRDGNGQLTLQYLRAASDAPPSERFQTDTLSVVSLRLKNQLLKYGERASVVDFLERSARLNPIDGEELLRDAAAIRAGKMPASYQYMVSRQ